MSLRHQFSYLPAFVCLLLGVLLLGNPTQASQGFQSAMQLCLQTVLPALFPYFVLCELLLSCPLQGAPLRRLGRLVGLRSEAAATALLLSWFGGYAVCAQLVGRLHGAGKLTDREATLLLMLGCCSSPGFVISCVGGLLLGNVSLGILLYALQLAANFLSTAICLPLLPADTPSSLALSSACSFDRPNLSSAINQAVSSCLRVCGCVLFFRMIAAILLPLFPAASWSLPVLSCFLEITSGCAAFSALGGRIALYGCCLCLSLLSLSVWAQISLLTQRCIALRPLYWQRCVHLPCFVLLVHLFSRFLPGTFPVYRTLASRVISTHRLPPDAALVGFLFVCAALYKVRQNFYNG